LESESGGRVPMIDSNNFDIVAKVPIDFTDTSFTVTLPKCFFGGEEFNYGVNVGNINFGVLTDKAPNEGVATSGGILPTCGSADILDTCYSCGDFNGDGFHDLAVGIPGEDIGSIVDGGAVQAIYGSPQGLHPTLSLTNQQIHQNSAGIVGFSETDDHFGANDND